MARAGGARTAVACASLLAAVARAAASVPQPARGWNVRFRIT